MVETDQTNVEHSRTEHTEHCGHPVLTAIVITIITITDVSPSVIEVMILATSSPAKTRKSCQELDY